MTTPPEYPEDHHRLVNWSEAGDHDITDQLRATLGRQADSVHPGDRFAQIQHGVSASRPAWRTALVAAVAVGVVAVGGFGIVTALLPGTDRVGVPAAPPTGLVGSPSPTMSQSPSPSRPAAPSRPPSASSSSSVSGRSSASAPRSSGTSGTPVAPRSSASSSPSGSQTAITPRILSGVPVYYLGDSKTRSWLYREFRQVPDVGDRTASAISAMTSLAPLDRDYRTPWRPASRVTVTQVGSDLTVDLSADALANSAVDDQEAGLAVQQLIWTATAAAQTSGNVTILVDGKPSTAWGSVQLGQPMARNAQARAPIWIIDPQQDQTDQAGTVTVSGSSTSFEGTVQWEVADTGSRKIIEHGHATGGANGSYGDFSFKVKLPGGTYTVSVYAEDASGGESNEGPKMFVDTKTWTVK